MATASRFIAFVQGQAYQLSVCVALSSGDRLNLDYQLPLVLLLECGSPPGNPYAWMVNAAGRLDSCLMQLLLRMSQELTSLGQHLHDVADPPASSNVQA